MIGAVEETGVTAAAHSIPLSPNVAMSVDEAEQHTEQTISPLDTNHDTAVNTGRTSQTAAADSAAMVGDEAFFAPSRTLSHSRCSQERGDMDGVSGVDADGGVNVAMPPVDSDPLQLHSSQPQTMV